MEPVISRQSDGTLTISITLPAGNDKPVYYEIDEHPHPEGHSTLLGFWIYLMSDCLIFAILFACYAVLGGSSVARASGSAFKGNTPSLPSTSNLYVSPTPRRGTNSSHTPALWRRRMG